MVGNRRPAATVRRLIHALMIEILQENIIYENPRPHVHSRHGFFPGLVQLHSGDLLALFIIAEAFEAPDGTTMISRSKDLGETWTLEGPLYDKRQIPIVTTDTLKPAVLRSGKLIATGYRFHRRDTEEGIGIDSTGGIQPGDNLVSFSDDEGQTWSTPQIIQRSYPELLEISGPCVELCPGELIASAAPYKMPDGSNPSGPTGVILRSLDGGRTWDDNLRFFEDNGRRIAPLESRLCRMAGDRLACLAWAYDYDSDRHLPNHIVYSSDGGRSWTPPLDTGLHAQASNLIWVADEIVLSIHAHRSNGNGIFIRLVDTALDGWRVMEEQPLWSDTDALTQDRRMTQMFQALRFGQPSLLKLHNGDILATYWKIEDGQGRIKSHRLRLTG